MEEFRLGGYSKTRQYSLGVEMRSTTSFVQVITLLDTYYLEKCCPYKSILYDEELLRPRTFKTDLVDASTHLEFNETDVLGQVKTSRMIQRTEATFVGLIQAL